MPEFTVPGVFVEEVPERDVSILDLPTDIPAFLGYTERGDAIREISSVAEYELEYGGARPTAFVADVAIDHHSVTVTVETPGGGSSQPEFLMPYAIRHYFANGGRSCFVVPLGRFGPSTAADFTAGLERLRDEENPTLVVLVDAVTLPVAEYAGIAAQALELCAGLNDRFAVLDVPGGDVDGFRDGIGTDHLAYGAAYHPYLVTTLEHVTSEDQVVVHGLPQPGGTEDAAFTLADLAEDDPIRGEVNRALAAHRVVLPPSAAVAGIYASTDRDRGVWKAPANALVVEVVGPTERLTDADQDRLHVDAVEGKSINAIREFEGRGTLVWGARTLAGNDNEWRYVPVRRFFINIEHSIDRSTQWAVFEPNEAATWTLVRAAIDGYLRRLWQAGGLVGSTPDDSFYVRAGLGQTMTEQDLLDGRLVIEVGVAVVRPAEFVVLRITKLLEGA